MRVGVRREVWDLQVLRVQGGSCWEAAVVEAQTSRRTLAIEWFGAVRSSRGTWRDLDLFAVPAGREQRERAVSPIRGV